MHEMLEAVEGMRPADPPGVASGPAPAASVAAELLRAGANALALPFRTAAFLARAEAVRAAVRADLATTSAVQDAVLPRTLPARPLRFFVSAAEASGERHAVRLVESLRAELARAGAPPPEIVGLGGERLRAAGVETLADPTARAAMGAEPLRSLPFYARLLARTAERLRTFRPDVCVPVDSPALHVPLARIARAHGLCTVHYVAPQYWGWAPWRVAAYRRAVDLVLAILPFEPAWFARHGVKAAYVGHPELEENLASAPDARERGGLVLLPGSRRSVIERNLPWMLARTAELRARVPGLEVAVVQDRDEHRARIEEHVRAAGAQGWARLALGDLHGELAGARAAFSVSGTILIDLLQHRLPAAVVYRVGNAFSVLAARRMLTVPHFSSVNLLAGEGVYLEACFSDEGPREEVLGHLERALTDEESLRRTRAALDRAARRLGPPGADGRAARLVLASLSR